MVFGKQEAGGTQGTGNAHISVTVTSSSLEELKNAVGELHRTLNDNGNGEQKTEQEVA